METFDDELTFATVDVARCSCGDANVETFDEDTFNAVTRGVGASDNGVANVEMFVDKDTFSAVARCVGASDNGVANV